MRASGPLHRGVAACRVRLDAAGALFLFQLTFTDLDLSTFPPPLPANLGFFASLGLVDAELHRKPALDVWGSLYALRRR
jgi:hypothetical protein